MKLTIFLLAVFTIIVFWIAILPQRPPDNDWQLKDCFERAKTSGVKPWMVNASSTGNNTYDCYVINWDKVPL